MLLTLCLTLLGLATTASADPANPLDSTSLDQCIDQAAGITAAMRDCETLETQRLDTILNASYKSIMRSSMDSKDKEALKALQRTWLAQREKTMKILSKYVGDGSLAALEIDTAYREILQSQTIILWQLANYLKRDE